MRWGIPLYLGVAFGSYWLIAHEIVPAIERLVALAPVIRIGSAALLAPFLMAICPVVIALVILKAIPYEGAVVKKLEYALNALVFAAGGALLLILVASTLVQSHYMAKLGYTRCGLLQGNPTMWFTDWVRNPDWCVRGKTREWVAEQARLAESTGKQP